MDGPRPDGTYRDKMLALYARADVASSGHILTNLLRRRRQIMPDEAVVTHEYRGSSGKSHHREHRLNMVLAMDDIGGLLNLVEIGDRRHAGSEDLVCNATHLGCIGHRFVAKRGECNREIANHNLSSRA